MEAALGVFYAAEMYGWPNVRKNIVDGGDEKERRQEKSDATLFCMKNPITGKYPAAAYDSIASAGVRTNGSICAKKERAAPNSDCSGFW